MSQKFCFIGAVDCGKSTLAGHLLYKLGGISEHDVQQIQNKCTGKETSQMWSRVLDIYEEEQMRGKTNEFDFKDITYNNKHFTIIDTPGHKIFSREMIIGLLRFSNEPIIAILVLSAAKKEFESGWKNQETNILGQTKEDIFLVRAAGINNIIIAINKMDYINWDFERYQYIKNESYNYIKKFGFDTINYIPLSGFQGIGLVNNDFIPNWYNDNHLMGLLDDISQNIISPTSTILPVPFDTIKCKLSIMWTPPTEPISNGFIISIHYENIEVEGEILALRNPNSNKKGLYIAKKGETIEALIKTDKIIKQELGTNRMIIRYKGETIGYAKIIAVK